MSSPSFFKTRQERRQPYPSAKFLGGFTVIEMITVTAIFMIMTSVVLANLPEFRNRSSLELVAQEVALVIRQAQAFGSITRGAVFSGGATADFPSYGIYLNLGNESAIPGPSPTSFILFADRPENTSGSEYRAKRYDHLGGCGAANSECRELYSLQGGIIIDKIELCPDATCSSPASPNLMNIIFQRPNPEALFTDVNGDALSCSPSSCSYAKITLKMNSNNTCSDIRIWNTGHIYSQAVTSC